MSLSALSPEAVNWLIGVWLFAFGGVIGSFLNVVVYRLPTGMSVVEPGSHCPACKVPIRWFDNVPIFSWIILRGRCRDCRSEIAMRYPIVEGITAGLFLLLGAVECLGGGANLPLQGVEPSAGLYAICAYHLLLLCTLLAAVLIEYDGHRLPARLFGPALLAGIAAPMDWPHLHPVPAPFLPFWAAVPREFARFVGGPTGLAFGVLLGWLASCPCGARWRTGLIFTSACVGAFLGWQAAVVLWIVTLAIHLPVAILGRRRPGVRRIPPTTWLAPAALAWILLWTWLAPWLSARA